MNLTIDLFHHMHYAYTTMCYCYMYFCLFIPVVQSQYRGKECNEWDVIVFNCCSYDSSLLSLYYYVPVIVWRVICPCKLPVVYVTSNEPVGLSGRR